MSTYSSGSQTFDHRLSYLTGLSVDDLHRQSGITRVTLDCPASEIQSELTEIYRLLYDAWHTYGPFVVLVKTTQGTGKTTSIMDTADAFTKPVGVFGPRHSDLEEDASRFGSRYPIHFVGKDRECINESYKDNHQNVSVEISQSWCDGCPLAGECPVKEPYRELNNSVDSFLGVHEHLRYLPEVLDEMGVWQAVNAVLIDESPWDAIIEGSLTIERSDVHETKEAIETIRDDDRLDCDPVVFEQLIKALTALSREIKTGEECSYTAMSEAVDLLDDEDGLRMELAEEQATTLKSGTKYTDVLLELHQVMPQIRASWEHAIAEERLLRDELPPQPLWQRDEHTGTLTVTWLHEVLQPIVQEKPTFILATELPAEKVAKVVDVPVIVIEDDVKPELETIQLTSKGMGITQLQKNDTPRENLFELTALAVQRESIEGNKTFIATKKVLEEPLKADLEDHGFVENADFKIGHYYALMGSNRFEDCQAAVLCGSAYLSSEGVTRTRILTGIDSETLKFEGATGEMRDAVHRIRPIHMEAGRLYTFTNVPSINQIVTESSVQKTGGVTELRQYLRNRIDEARQQADLREEIMDFLSGAESHPTTTEVRAEIGNNRETIQVLEELVSDGVVKKYKESTGGPGRPAHRFRLHRASN